MAAFDDLKMLYYIKDSFGNYYRLNGDKELVAAREQVEAGIFTYLEVSERLGNGKKTQFYKAVPVEESDKSADIGGDRASVTCSRKTDKSSNPCGRKSDAADSDNDGTSAPGHGGGLHFTDFSELAQVDWIELLNNLAFIHAMMPAYKDKLNKDQSETELLLIDLMHLVELYDYDDVMSVDIIDKIREAREKRRVIKNEIFRVERFQDAVGSNAIAIRTRDALEKIKKKEAGTYRPRVSPDLFTDVSLRPRKLHRCFAEGCQDIEEHSSVNSCDIADEPEREECEMAEVRYERIGTVYDECKPDWREFVRQQAEFFRNAEDYISDLRYDLDQVDLEIEQALEDMEGANYNAVQGYQAFRVLKDLRIRRKELFSELENVHMITRQFDCGTMLEAYEEIETEMLFSSNSPT